MKKTISGRIIFLFFILIFSFNLYGNQPLIMSIPKSGSHLLTNLFTEILKKPEIFLRKPGDFFRTKDNHIYFCHFNIKPQSNIVKNLKPLFVNIRDPRDVLVSSVYFYSQLIEMLIGRSTFDEKLSYLISMENLVNCCGPYYMFARALEVIKTYNPLVIRFEDLVGPMGGGTAGKQKMAIRTVLNSLGIAKSDLEIEKLGKRSMVTAKLLDPVSKEPGEISLNLSI